MQQDNKEVELKLPVKNKKDIIEKLNKLGAVFISEVRQQDYLYDSPYIDFQKKDEACRLRKEILKKVKKSS